MIRQLKGLLVAGAGVLALALGAWPLALVLVPVGALMVRHGGEVRHYARPIARKNTVRYFTGRL